MTRKIEADDEQEVENSTAPLLQHLYELRSRLIWSLLALAGGTILCFVFAEPLYNLLLTPLVRVAEIERGDATFRLIYTGPLEVFFAQLKLALFAGIFVAFPAIAWQVYSFVAPGLYKNERRAFLPFLISAPALFVTGAVFVYIVMLPLISQFALSFEQEARDGVAAIESQIRVSEYLSLVMALMLAFGLSFQLPVVVSLLGKAGLVSAGTLRTGRKYAAVAILAFAAFFTPPDIISQVMLAVPVMILYEISIWCVVMIERAREREDAEREGEE
ncbi:twin-arginine translocase subunit TatC [Ponticaulis profundi]|uniref:Sec-independent protein translocase protein TatC n=1 Tax=Ponticaulis profundi TaxID=2665222 RepID=A0ABW1SDU3_9PROT